MKIKIEPEKLLSGLSIVLGLASMAVTSMIQTNDKKILKAELKEDLLKELLKKQD